MMESAYIRIYSKEPYDRYVFKENGEKFAHFYLHKTSMRTIYIYYFYRALKSCA